MTITKGSGGGGKSGGGSARVAVEAPDSLRSKQYARVVDLVSEGEIQGLVDGLKSVYLDNTPIQNSDGSNNFEAVTFDNRVGTQSQSYIKGFSAVESETPVSVEITNGSPVVRTISGAGLDAVRITVSVPSLTKQNTTNGDISGTSVQLSVAVQTDGGGYVNSQISQTSISLSVGGGVASSLTRNITDAAINIGWIGVAAATYQTVSYRVDYRVVGAGTWVALNTGSFIGTGVRVIGSLGYFGGANYVTTAPIGSKTVQFSGQAEDAYEFRVVLVSGSGSLSIDGSASTWIGSDTIRGKTKSRYQRSYRVPLSGGTTYDIRVTRITADSGTVSLQNETYWDSYTAITEGKFTYPNSALMAISIDAEKFSSIPTRSYEIEGMILSVPSNYNTLTREYSGVWDGTFKAEYSNNPAWVFYEMVTNDRFGLGDLITASLIDKWALYEIAQYCDVLVSDGLSGLEPRFTCNMYLQDRSEAYKVLETLAAVFNGLAYWANDSITAVQDSPKSPVALFTPANIVGGAFNYSGSSMKTRHTVALVSWNDPTDNYNQSIEYVADEEGIARYGFIKTDVAAVGCTSRGQAHRLGRAILYSERMETDTITFKAGLDSLAITVGDVINTTDPIRAGVRRGGRLVSATTTAFTLDSEIVISSGVVHTLWLVMPDGDVESQTILTGAGTVTAITTNSFSDTAATLSMWVVSSTTLVAESWRVLSIVESDDTNAEITALEYRSDKYAAIEDNVILEPVPTSQLQVIPDIPVNIVASESLYLISQSVVGTRLSVSWTGTSARYEVQYREGEGNWTTVTTQAAAIDIEPVTAGTYSVKVLATNPIGIKSSFANIDKIVYGLTAPPVDVSGFELAAITGSAFLTWNAATDLDVVVGGTIKIRHSTDIVSPTWSSATDIGGVIAGSNISTTLPLIQGTYLAKWVDSSGNQSVNETLIITNAPNIIAFNFIEELTETGFSGTKTGTAVSDGGLILDSVNTISEQPGLISTWPKMSFLGGIASSGSYAFASAVDIGSVQTSRITTALTVTAFDASDLISARPLISTWDNIIGGLIDDVDATLFVRTSNDNVTFGAWEKLIIGDYSARAFQFKLELESNYETHNIKINSLSVSVDMPDRISSGEDVVSGAASKSITFPFNYQVIPAIGITAQNMETGDFYEISNKAVGGFDIIFKNSGGAAISRTFDHITRGY